MDWAIVSLQESLGIYHPELSHIPTEGSLASWILKKGPYMDDGSLFSSRNIASKLSFSKYLNLSSLISLRFGNRSR